MFSIKKLMNRKTDEKQCISYKHLVFDIRNCSETTLASFIEHTDVQSMKAADKLSELVDHIVASIDLYAENKFAVPSTILGLRNGAVKLSDGTRMFIAALFDNLSNRECEINELMQRFIKATDLIMTARKIIMHSIELEFRMVQYDVDIIERYYQQQKHPNKDIIFNVSFKQPSHILKTQKEDKPNGSVKRNGTQSNGI